MIPEPTQLLLSLFETVPHVMICVKDDAGRYVAVNEAFVQRTNRRTVLDVVGCRAADLFPAELAASYDAQDRTLFATGRPVRNQLEIITDAGGRPGWYLSTKVLASSASGALEIVAVSVAVPLTRSGAARAGGLRAAVELVRREFHRPLRVDELAAVAGLSTDQLERAMQRALGVSPKQYVLRTRAEHAAFLLATTDQPISQISAGCGYFDQSQLTRQFSAFVGVTPGRYRALSRADRDRPSRGS